MGGDFPCVCSQHAFGAVLVTAHSCCAAAVQVGMLSGLCVPTRVTWEVCVYHRVACLGRVVCLDCFLVIFALHLRVCLCILSKFHLKCGFSVCFWACEKGVSRGVCFVSYTRAVFSVCVTVPEVCGRAVSGLHCAPSVYAAGVLSMFVCPRGVTPAYLLPFSWMVCVCMSVPIAGTGVLSLCSCL